ncbi:MAG TPA: SigB/SigF/SigG family RNA polymerase sigma factor [Solirubrobacterales bacterium]|jgi:RNA polymerase sigma-B factor|nr:SigB/SigF/SigG family RNA polymerase sigma factor [Solirubrobacterales bacterium]
MSAVLNEANVGTRESELWRRLTTSRDQAARAELVNLYMPLARRMASRYAGVSEPYDDLLQVASLGLLNAIDRFDAGRGTPFAGFAKPTILGELKRHFRDKVWTVRVPRSVHDRMAEVEKATEKLTLELRRPPSVEQLSAEVEIPVAEVLEILEAKHNRRPLSLDAPPIGENPEDASGAEWVGRPDGNFDLVDDRLAVESVLPSLDDREREVLRLRFVEELPQTEIALRVGCSQMHISRLLRRALDKLREEAERTPEATAA